MPLLSSMEARTTVIFTLSPPPIPIFRRKFSLSLSKPSSSYHYSSIYLSPRNSRFRILNVSQGPSQGDYYGSSTNDVTLQPASILTLSKGLLKFVLSNLLPISLLVGVALGFTSPTLGRIAQKYSFSKFITCWLFFLSGLKSQDGDVKEVIKDWPALFYGLEFVTGMAIMSCMPTTTNGGVALTQLVGGNSTLALALTVISVLLGILIVPLWITKFFADGYGIAIPTWVLFRSLVIILVVPLVIGKVTRKMFPDIGRFVEQNGTYFSFTTSILLGFFPWMQVSTSRHLLLLVKPEIFVCAILLGIFVHLSFLFFTGTLVRTLSVGPFSWQSVFAMKGNRRALMLVCSQRSVVIATAVVEQLGGVLGQSGLLLLPCVAYDVTQIVIDSLVVNFWRRKDELGDIAKKA